MQQSDKDCLFCSKFGNEPKDSRHPYFDFVIWENENFVVVPAKGSFVTGYLIIITKKHLLSMANLPDNLLLELSQIKSHIRKILSRLFTRPVFFEHGDVCATEKAGGCIKHAHMHCLPLELDVFPRLMKSYKHSKIKSFEEIRKNGLENKSYIYFENQFQDKYILSQGKVAMPSQYLRRVIAEELDMPDEWDWNVAPFESNVRETLKIVNGTIIEDVDSPTLLVNS